MNDATEVRSGIHALRVDPAHCPGSVSGAERLPSPGERVYTIEGTAVVGRLLGRTGSGGRLLELTMDDGRKAPFFAAAANVRVSPRGGDPIARTVEGATSALDHPGAEPAGEG